MKPLAMVVGASQRIGREIAIEFARCGFDLITTYRSDYAGALATQAQAQKFGATVNVLQLDLSDASAVLNAVQFLRLQKLDALIVSAGLWEQDAASHLVEHQAAQLMLVNCHAPIQLARALTPALSHSSLSGGASVMAFGDIHSHVKPIKGFTHYLESKKALRIGFEKLALELAPSVRVNVIVAGVIAWPDSMDASLRANALSKIPLARAGTPKDAAVLVRFVTLEAPFMTGASITLDGGRSINPA